MTTLNFSLTLPDLMYRELIDRCTLCGILPKQFAAEALEATLAGIRLPNVEVGRNGAFTSGAWGGVRHEKVEPETPEEAGLIQHRVMLPKMCADIT